MATNPSLQTTRCSAVLRVGYAHRKRLGLDTWCSNKASVVVDGKPLCGTHARIPYHRPYRPPIDTPTTRLSSSVSIQSLAQDAETLLVKLGAERRELEAKLAEKKGRLARIEDAIALMKEFRA